MIMFVCGIIYSTFLTNIMCQDLVLSAPSLIGNGLKHLANVGAPVYVRAFSFLLAEFTGFTKRNGENPRLVGLAYYR
jgi:hypothetical protein